MAYIIQYMVTVPSTFTLVYILWHTSAPWLVVWDGMEGLWRLLPGAQTLQAWWGGSICQGREWEHQLISNETLILTLIPVLP